MITPVAAQLLRICAITDAIIAIRNTTPGHGPGGAARILRRLAASAHGSGIRDRLERLAEQCEDLADSIEQNASNDEA
jgi:hypothetical protein